MIFTPKNFDEYEKINELNETRKQLKAEQLKEKLGKQDFHYDMKEVFEPLEKAIKESDESQTRAITGALTDATKSTTALTNQLIDTVKDIEDVHQRDTIVIK